MDDAGAELEAGTQPIVDSVRRSVGHLKWPVTQKSLQTPPEARSRMMAAIRGKNTKPEMRLRQFLHRSGFRYRLHDKALPGSPDLILPRYRTVIFVHGCFWHQHPNCKYASTPSTNVEFWQDKLKGNTIRDKKNIESLTRMGWRVIVIWECGIRRKTAAEDLIWLPKTITNEEILINEWPKILKNQF